MIVACPDVRCSGTMEHWQRSIRYRCTACQRLFDFVLASPNTQYPEDVPARPDGAAKSR